MISRMAVGRHIGQSKAHINHRVAITSNTTSNRNARAVKPRRGILQRLGGLIRLQNALHGYRGYHPVLLQGQVGVANMPLHGFLPA